MAQNSLLEYDRALSQRLRIAETPGKLRTLAAILAHSGDSWFWLAGIALLWLLGPRLWRPEELVFLIAILAATVPVFVLKLIIRRRRPVSSWGAIYRITDPHSFPSGHAARAALLAVLAIGLGPPWLGLILVFWAPLVILARVAMGVHYLSDVIAGAILGILVGLIILAVV